MSNEVTELQTRINDLKIEAENLIKTNPEHAVISARKACEAICTHICIKEKLITDKISVNSFNLAKKIYLISDHSKAPQTIIEDIRFIQKKGNSVVHTLDKINPEDAEPVLKALSNLVNWYFQGTTCVEHKNEEKPQDSPNISPDIEKDDFKGIAKNTIKKPWFQNLAVGVMAATATALAAKGLTDKKSDDEK